MKISSSLTIGHGVFWKEVRENAIWAVVGALLIIAGNMLVAFSNASNAYYQDYNQGVDACFYYLNGFSFGLIVYSQIIATVLGLVQILPEQRRDQWAFLVHHPLSLSALFWRKVAAGLFLYFLATVVPFLLMAGYWRLRLLGVAPTIAFEPNWLLGGWADIWMGLPFYFAALLVGLRPTRWYGSRSFPLLSCIPLMMYVFPLYEFGSVVLLGGAATLVLAGAAWGSFVAMGHYQSQPRWTRALLGLSLVPTLAGIGCIVVASLNTSISYVLPDQTPPANTEDDASQEVYGITPEGIPGRMRVTYGEASPALTTLSGKVVPGKKGHAPMPFYYRAYNRADSYSYRDPQRYLIALSRNYYEDRSGLYYSRSQRRIQIDNGYMTTEGYIGPDGFYWASDRLPNRARFSSQLVQDEGDDFLLFEDGLYKLNFRNRSIRLVHAGRDMQAVDVHAKYREKKIVSSGSSYTRNERVQSVCSVVTPTAIEFYDGDGNPLCQMPREHDSKAYSEVSTLANKACDRFYLLYSPTSDIPTSKRDTMPYYLVTLSRRGQVLKRETLPPLPPDMVSSEYMAPWQVGGLGLSVPLVAPVAITALSLPAYVKYGLPLSLWMADVHTTYPYSIAITLIAIVTGLMCAAVAALIGKRCGFSWRQQWAWCLGVFLLGPLGLLILIAVRGWPARVSCDSCQKRRVVNREACEHCGGGWPKILRDGTEVFVDAGVV